MSEYLGSHYFCILQALTNGGKGAPMSAAAAASGAEDVVVSGVLANPKLTALAQAMAADAEALNALSELVDKLTRNPTDQTAAVLMLKGKLAPVAQAAGGIGVQFLQELGYARNKGFWALQSKGAGGGSGAGREVFLQAKMALDQAKGDFEYQLAQTAAASRASAVDEAAAALRSLRSKPPKPEPAADDPAALSTRLVFHFKAVSPGGGDSGAAAEDLPTAGKLERRFAPDDSLADVVHYLGTLDERSRNAPPSSHSWELVEGATTDAGAAFEVARQGIRSAAVVSAQPGCYVLCA